MKMIPKSKNGGIVNDVVQGTGGLIIGVIIVLVIVSTLLGANLLSADDRTIARTAQTITTVNETGGALFGYSTYTDSSCSVTTAMNLSGAIIAPGNYTVTASECTLAWSGDDDSAAFYNNTAWVINSSTVYAGLSEYAANDMASNFTAGLDNVSEKIPTILLIAAVVLLFGVLVLLVAKSKEMGIGGGTSL